MILPHPFIRLPFSFNVKQLQQEVAQFKESNWLAHPNRMQGNAAIPLISVNGEDNDEFSGHMQATPHLKKCEYIQQVMASFDEVIARSRLMRLGPGCEVSQHVDFNYHWYSRVRIHIPIVTQPKVIFYCGDQQVHMQAGECWIFDSWRQHKVINSWSKNRTHLVIDTAGSARFWQMVEDAAQSKPSQLNIQDISYQAGFTPIIKTEKFNVAPVMAPGELEAITNELVADFSANSNNDADLVGHYKRLLRDLAKDWRAIWLQHGITEAGTPHYQSILHQTIKNMSPNPRALVTKSNNVGVNPIIMQRIVRAALALDERERYLS